MATVVYNPAKDWFEIFRLAGGDHFQSTLDAGGINLINNTTTQVALDAAIVSNFGGTKSVGQIAEDKEANEAFANPTVLALAMLGHDPSIASLQAMTPLTDSVSDLTLPAGKIGALKSIYFIGTVPPLTAVPTISTAIPVVTSVTKGITNALGSLTVSMAGIYQLSFTSFVTHSNRKFIYTPTVFVNAVLNTIFGSTLSVKNQAGTPPYPVTSSFSKTLVLAANDVVVVKQITDDTAATCSIDFSMVRIG